MTKNYALLEKHIAKINKISTAGASLHWDLTQNTPDGAKENLSEDIGNLSSIAHEMFISKHTEDLILASEGEKLDDWQSANLRLIKKDYISSTALSAEFVEKFSILTSQGQSIWQKAKISSDWDAFAPYLKKIVISVREMADIKSAKLGVKPYEALLNEYDAGRTLAEIESVFTTLKASLPALICEIIEKQKSEQVLPITNPIESGLQKEISVKIMQNMKFDFSNGRIDEYEHPYCTTTSGGVRILSKFEPQNFLQGIMATIHETGHALYEQNLPKAYKNQPVGKACGMSVHESQSLFMELQVARSKSFSEYLSKLLKDNFSFKGQEFSSENLYRLLNRTKRSLIRVEADEATYPLHVILRFELEKALLDGSINVEDLPEIWNKKMKEYLDITPENHKTGVMQDVHWSSGGFGYFPCYVGGSINASMLAQAAKKCNSFTDKDLAKGDLNKVTDFLKENIWHNGSRFSPSKLIENATGINALSPEVFIGYLKRKFL